MRERYALLVDLTGRPCLAVGGGNGEDGAPSGGNSTLVYFSCEDVAQEESRVEAAGGRIQRKKMSIGEYGNISLAFDTEGNLFGVHSKQ